METWPDLLIGMIDSIGGELDVHTEASNQVCFGPLQQLHHNPVGYQPCTTSPDLFCAFANVWRLPTQISLPEPENLST